MTGGIQNGLVNLGLSAKVNKQPAPSTLARKRKSALICQQALAEE